MTDPISNPAATETVVVCVYDNGCGKDPSECPVTCKAVLDAVAMAVRKRDEATAAIRDRIAAALYERERPPRDPHWPDAYPVDREVFEAMADAVVAELREPVTWTPPPPGDRREQLPDHLLALVDIPPYLSTACEAAQLLSREMPHALRRVELGDHSDRMHSRCRINNKFTGAICYCPCHPEPGTA